MMERPADLPRPVREHPAHQIPMTGTSWCSPGPAAYEGYGITTFDRDHRGGVFFASRDRAGVPTKRGPMLARASSTPGPKYDQNPTPATKLATSFTRAKRFAFDEKVQRESGPGPGAFFDESVHSSIGESRRRVSSAAGTLPRARRMPTEHKDRLAEPSAADYSRQDVVSSLSNKVNHGPSSFPHASVKHRTATTAKHCETAEVILPGDDELRQAESWTRPMSNRGVSIGRSKRFVSNARPSSADVGPGMYDNVEASRRLAKSMPMVGFAQGARTFSFQRTADPEIVAGGGGTGPMVLPSTLNTSKGARLSPHRGTSPPSDKSRNHNNDSTGGGGGVGGDNVGPGQYDPDVAPTKPSRCVVSIGRAPRMGRNLRPATTEVDLIELPSTLDTKHGASIGTGKRFRMSAEEREWVQHPSSADYSPRPPRTPDNRSRSLLNRNEKIGQLMREARETPGPKYDEVDMNLMREPLAKPVAFPRANRGLLNDRLRGNGVPGAGTYDPQKPSRHQRTAILYLGG